MGFGTVHPETLLLLEKGAGDILNVDIDEEMIQIGREKLNRKLPDNITVSWSIDNLISKSLCCHYKTFDLAFFRHPNINNSSVMDLNIGIAKEDRTDWKVLIQSIFKINFKNKGAHAFCLVIQKVSKNHESWDCCIQ